VQALGSSLASLERNTLDFSMAMRRLLVVRAPGCVSTCGAISVDSIREPPS
jgi:hypothetical protein